ncbi:LolA family protein [Goodfellowiella coeruleoviolacea]|uniref:Outer membrane lipoprotein-sorting protein n=1 Tax=Goodfellowiella coeruleoviolacea TaxID=334858 RepID=A0AAE3GCM6_9PSEU|nr:sigma-E factor regulatory protein RseB domain-containing protein [Goodfellowiella coeruleoviolacea]MCP2165640.1 Outer membrane lipoprotein-sorting protein [Goodfellowiella coeruleoviolacea]
MSKRTTVAFATAGAVAGVVGLGVLAMPAGAGPNPTLPEISAEQLVESVFKASPAALGGTVQVENNLGLPSGLPNMPAALSGDSRGQVWTDGQGRVRVSLPSSGGELSYVNDGSTSWLWDSADRSVRKSDNGAARARHDLPELADAEHQAELANPVSAAKQVVSAVQEYSTVAVDGTATVAGRSAYEVVLTPKPTERTLLREVRVAVDAELRLPLRFSVLANGTDQPVLQVGFSELTVGQQDPGLFQFSVPAGATVTEEGAEQDQQDQQKQQEQQRRHEQAPFQAFGSGWDTVLAGRMPAEALSGSPDAQDADAQDADGRDADGRDADARGQSPAALLKQVGKQVSGEWGQGVLVSTAVANALITDDGRVAVGAVPEQVLVETIGQLK